MNERPNPHDESSSIELPASSAPSTCGSLAHAVQRADWYAAAHYILAGAAIAAAKLPPATLDDLLAALTPEHTDDRVDR